MHVTGSKLVKRLLEFTGAEFTDRFASLAHEPVRHLRRSAYLPACHSRCTRAQACLRPSPGHSRGRQPARSSSRSRCVTQAAKTTVDSRTLILLLLQKKSTTLRLPIVSLATATVNMDAIVALSTLIDLVGTESDHPAHCSLSTRCKVLRRPSKCAPEMNLERRLDWSRFGA